MVAYSFFTFISVAGIVVGIAEELVGNLDILARHVVVIAVYAGPHVFGKIGLAVQVAPKRITSTPGADVATMQYPVEVTSIAAFQRAQHRHGRLHPFGQGSISMEIGDDGCRPFARFGCGLEIAYLAFVARTYPVHVFSVGFQVVKLYGIAQEACLFIEVLSRSFL